MISTILRRTTGIAASIVIACLVVVGTAAAVSAHGPAGHAQRRQIAAATLTDFRVVVTVTRGDMGHRFQATVTAAGYQRTAGHWKQIAVKRVGKVNGWFWFSVKPCSLTATQLKNNSQPSPPVIVADSMKISLLITPAIGCSRTYSKHWKP